jgi:hypothetical protein
LDQRSSFCTLKTKEIAEKEKEEEEEEKEKKEERERGAGVGGRNVDGDSELVAWISRSPTFRSHEHRDDEGDGGGRPLLFVEGAEEEITTHPPRGRANSCENGATFFPAGPFPTEDEGKTLENLYEHFLFSLTYSVLNTYRKYNLCKKIKNCYIHKHIVLA